MRYYYLLFVMLYRFSAKYNSLQRDHDALVYQAYIGGIQMLTVFYLIAPLIIAREIISKFIIIDPDALEISTIILIAVLSVVNHYLIMYKGHYDIILKKYESVEINVNKGVAYLLLCSIVYALLLILLDKIIR